MSAQESSTTIRHAEKRRNSTCALADAIAKAALDAWRSLDVRTSRQTVVAAIVLQQGDGCTCLSLGAGTKTPSRAAVVAGGDGALSRELAKRGVKGLVVVDPLGLTATDDDDAAFDVAVARFRLPQHAHDGDAWLQATTTKTPDIEKKSNNNNHSDRSDHYMDHKTCHKTNKQANIKKQQNKRNNRENEEERIRKQSRR